MHTASHQFPQTRRPATHKIAQAEIVSQVGYPLDSDDPPIGTGAFSYMQFPQVHDVPLHDIVSVEHHEGTYDLEDEEETFKYRVAFEYLKRGSLDPERSRALISATTDEIWA